jgi:hypothetical protein
MKVELIQLLFLAVVSANAIRGSNRNGVDKGASGTKGGGKKGGGKDTSPPPSPAPACDYNGENMQSVKVCDKANCDLIRPTPVSQAAAVGMYADLLPSSCTCMRRLQLLLLNTSEGIIVPSCF